MNREVMDLIKYFNITADCKPAIHYMVNIQPQLAAIKQMVDKGEYFVINRARQYGKTTTLKALKKYLQNEYVVVDMDFQRQMSSAKFRSENSFSVAFGNAFLRVLQNKKETISSEMEDTLSFFQQTIREQKNDIDLVELFNGLSDICRVSDKPIVLMIDEVDSATNNQVFLDFLAQLRGYYIERDEIPTFQSVILAGVYDVKNLKQKIRDDKEHKTNSPWNIAATFDVDMSFSAKAIADMLRDYEQDHHTNMDVEQMANLIYDYTSGYPFLVSDLCKIIDESIAGSEQFPECCDAWTKEGFLKAVRILLTTENTLFESLDNKLLDFPELKQMLWTLLFNGRTMEYIPGNQGIRDAILFGFVKNKEGILSVANRIFEIRLYNGFLAEKAFTSEMAQLASEEKSRFVENGMLDMKKILSSFVRHYTDLFENNDVKFLEDNGRNMFLLYLRPIINGTGNYYIEARTRNNRRTDVIVDYLGKQYIIELKIWHGEEYNRRGEAQLGDYLDAYHQKTGYMLSFNFNKNKEIGVKEVVSGDKLIVEAVV